MGDLTASGAQFRTLLGDPANGGTAGQQPGGWREIKWDGVPADRTNIVFSDVDLAGSAGIEPFTASGQSLGRYNPPVRSDAAGHSFVGVVFDDPLIARVVITSGQAALGAGVNDLSGGGTVDLVVPDDFLYAEPEAGS